MLGGSSGASPKANAPELFTQNVKIILFLSVFFVFVYAAFRAEIPTAESALNRFAPRSEWEVVVLEPSSENARLDEKTEGGDQEKEDYFAPSRSLLKRYPENEYYFVKMTPLTRAESDATRDALGVYDAKRGYRYIPTSCTATQRLHHEKRLLECSGKAGKTIIDGKPYCSGLPLLPDLCTQAATGYYVYDRPTVVTEDALPTCALNASFRFSPVQPYPIISEDASCAFPKDPTHKRLLSVLRGKILIIVGDSHARNFFTALVSSVRNERLIVERHQANAYTGPDMRFEVHETHDVLEYKAHLPDPTNPASRTLSHWTEEEARGPCRPGAARGSKQDCAVVMFVWASRREPQLQLMAPNGTLHNVMPDALVYTFISVQYGNVAKDPAKWVAFKAAWLKYLTERRARVGRPMAMVVTPFVNGGTHSTMSSKPWLASLPQNVSRFPYVLDQKPITDFAINSGIAMLQLNTSWHTVCPLHDGFNLLTYFEDPKREMGVEPAVKVWAHDVECSAPTERAFVQLALAAVAKELAIDP